MRLQKEEEDKVLSEQRSYVQEREKVEVAKHRPPRVLLQ